MCRALPFLRCPAGLVFYDIGGVCILPPAGSAADATLLEPEHPATRCNKVNQVSTRLRVGTSLHIAWLLSSLIRLI